MWTLADKYNVMTPERAAKELLKRLEKYKPYIFKKAVSRESVYIHFNGLPNALEHKLRISTHVREKYGYKWQLLLNRSPGVQNGERWSRYFRTVDELAENFTRYYDKVEKLNEEISKGWTEERYDAAAGGWVEVENGNNSN